MKQEEKKFRLFNTSETKQWLSDNDNIELSYYELHQSKIFLSESGEVLVFDESFKDGVLYINIYEFDKVYNRVIDYETNPFIENPDLVNYWDNTHVDRLINDLFSLLAINTTISNNPIEILNNVSLELNRINISGDNYNKIFLGCGALIGKYLMKNKSIEWEISNKTNKASYFTDPRPVLVSSLGVVYDPWFRIGKSLRKDDGQEINLYMLYLTHMTIDKIAKYQTR